MSNLAELNARITKRIKAGELAVDFTSLAYEEAVALGLAEADDHLVVGAGMVHRIERGVSPEILSGRGRPDTRGSREISPRAPSPGPT